MNTLIWFVILYWVASVGIGIFAARFVRSSRDFAVAGRALPLYIVTATVFSTWFGSEAILGIPATFIEEGFVGVISDPFCSGACLILVGLLIAKKLYRLNLMTITDYYRFRYSRTVEVIVALSIVLSYLGWVSAQIKALGLVFNIISDGLVSVNIGMAIGLTCVLIYTLLGGMWSIAITDFVQMLIIVGGIIYIAFEVAGMVPGGASAVVIHAYDAGKLSFIPEMNAAAIFGFIGAGLTMLFGSMPQQDIFQRVASAKNETIAKQGSIFGGMFYIIFALIPMFLCYATTLLDPALIEKLIGVDSQLIVPAMIMKYMPMLAQVVFFGALLSAIQSSASATLLAPSVTFSENILKGFFPNMSDRQHLHMMRATVLIFAGIVILFAMWTNASIFKMVENAYKSTLVVAFVPLIAGFFWKQASNRGALTSIIAGVFFWILFEIIDPEGTIPPQLYGFIAAITGMIVGSLIWTRYGKAQHCPTQNPTAMTGINPESIAMSEPDHQSSVPPTGSATTLAKSHPPLQSTQTKITPRINAIVKTAHPPSTTRAPGR